MLAAIICEYNPLHNGHIYHINQTKKYLESNNIIYDGIIAIMSGNFTQRGDIALLNKFTRAKIAIECGIDMVVELPSFFATSAAEYFALGAIKIASIIEDIKYISFGSECGDIVKLNEVCENIQSEKYNANIKILMKNGISYPKACEETYRQLFGSDFKFLPNNQLALQYIAAAKKLNANLNFITIQRQGGEFNSQKLFDNFSSASAIRANLKYGIDSLINNIPKNVADALTNVKINEDVLFGIIASKILDTDTIYEDNEGIVNRIKKFIPLVNSYEQLVNAVHTKRYTKGKIKRIFLHLILNHTLYEVKNLNYVNVLAINKNKKHLLACICNKSEKNIFSKNFSYENQIYNAISADKIKLEKMLIV